MEFTKDFSTTEQCRTYLCEQKWKDGYSCRKCGHDVSVKGRTRHHRKCQRCHYDESCTAHTLFHKLKFPIEKAFWIVYQLSTMKKGMSTLEISRQYGIHQETAWFFKRKVQQAMGTGKGPVLKGNVEVDEMTIGGSEEGAPGRSHGGKKIVQVAVEIDYPGDDDNDKPIMKNASAEVINDYSAEELGRAIDKMVDKDAMVTTDQWSSYPKAVGGRWHLTFPSEMGSNFEQLHWHIFNIKNWLRGIHHRISAKHTQRYLDEYHYRFNRRNQLASCPIRVLRRMINEPWLPYKIAVGT